MSNVAALFDADAERYDAARRRLIPPYDAFYGTGVEALALADAPPRRILDLGAGTGLLSAHIRAAHPEVHLTLSDAAPAMLERARAALGTDNATYVVADLNDPLPGEPPYDAIVSALAIHHLSDDDKRALFARIHAGLRPGGVFVNAEQVVGPTPRLTAVYTEWHARESRAAGATAAEWGQAQERMRYDRCATTEDQLGWLKAAGFAAADCLFKHYRFAVIAAV